MVVFVEKQTLRRISGAQGREDGDIVGRVGRDDERAGESVPLLPDDEMREEDLLIGEERRHSCMENLTPPS
jgi:hypothetical protein